MTRAVRLTGSSPLSNSVRLTALGAWIVCAAAAFAVLTTNAATMVVHFSGRMAAVGPGYGDVTRRAPSLVGQRGGGALLPGSVALDATWFSKERAPGPAVDRTIGVRAAHDQEARFLAGSIRPEPRPVALFFLILPAGSAVVASGATAKLRGRRRELRTLRALGWARSEIRRLLLQEFALLAVISGLAAALVAYLCEAALGRTSPSGWELLAIPAAVVMTIAAAWWPVRQATAAADPMATARAHGPADWTRRQPWMLGQAMRNLLRAPKRSALRVLVIAASCAALGEELAMRWAFGGTLVSSWLGHAISWQEDSIDTSVVITTLVLATVTVTELDWLSAHQQAIERRTLQAIGWSAYGVALLVAAEATLLGLAGGITASVIDVAGGFVIAHRVAAGMLATAMVVTGTGIVVSLLGAAFSAVWSRSRRGTTVPR